MSGLGGALGIVMSWMSVTAALAQPKSDERYYLVLFGCQSTPYRIRHTHTWATFVKTTPGAKKLFQYSRSLNDIRDSTRRSLDSGSIETASNGGVIVRADTVSWMPATIRIRALALRPEPGVNLTLEETFNWAKSVNASISMLGPYEIDREHYHRLLARKHELESGAIAYRALGGFTKSAPVSNCGQSFTRASPVVGRRFLNPTPEPGERGTTRLAARYVRASVLHDPHVSHDWLLPVIGVDPESVVRREPGEWVGRLR